MHKWVWASFTTAVAGCYSLHIKSWQPLPVAIEFLKLPGAPDGVDAQMVMQSNKKKSQPNTLSSQPNTLSCSDRPAPSHITEACKNAFMQQRQYNTMQSVRSNITRMLPRYVHLRGQI